MNGATIMKQDADAYRDNYDATAAAIADIGTQSLADKDECAATRWDKRETSTMECQLGPSICTREFKWPPSLVACWAHRLLVWWVVRDFVRSNDKLLACPMMLK